MNDDGLASAYWQAFITNTDFGFFLLSLFETFVGCCHQPACWVPVSIPPAFQGRLNMDLLLAFTGTEVYNLRTLTVTVRVPFCSVLLMHTNYLTMFLFDPFFCQFHEFDLRRAWPHEHDSRFHTFI
jgi:hypothetical protein